MLAARSIAIVWVWLVVALGCEPREAEPRAAESIPEAVEVAPGRPPVGAWVVIDERRGLFKTANRDAGHVVGAGLRVVEVVANVGDWIEVRTVAGDRGDVCSRVVDLQPHYELRFFVEPEALQQVLIGTMRAEFGDGTSVELRPGVPVIEVGTPGRVRLGSADLAVDVAEADVGRWFVASSIEPTVEPSVLPWKPGLVLHYGDYSFTAESEAFLVARDREPIDRGELLTFVNACGRFVLRTDAPVPPHWFGDGVLAVGGCGSTVRKIPAGTPLSWLGGGTAGVVLEMHELPREAETRDDRVCFEVSGLDVCVATGKLAHEIHGSCDWAELGFPSERSVPASKSTARVRPGKAKVGKGLDPDLVRRIVRAHLAEVNGCYAAGLARDPKLAGRVVIAFEVADTGKVASSSVKSTTLEPADEQVPTCIAKAFKRWTFPRARAGASASVVYPLQLSP